MKPVFVTGVGAVSAAGDETELRQRWLAGESAVQPVEGKDAGLPPGYGGAVAFDRRRMRRTPGGKSLRPGTMTEHTYLAAGAVGRALEHAGLADPTQDADEVAERRGVVIGSYTNFPELKKHYKLLHVMGSPAAWDGDGEYVIDDGRIMAGMKGFTGFDFLKLMNNMPTAHGTIQANARGAANTILGHASAGLQAVQRGWRDIEIGLVDQSIVGATGPGLSEGICFVHQGYEMLADPSAEPAAACRPMDQDATGIVPAEGGGALVIENEASLTARGATPLAKLVAAQELFVVPTAPRGPLKDSSGIAQLLRMTLDQAGWAPQDVDYIAPHGMGLASLDRLEAEAIAEVFGDHLPNLHVALHGGVTGFTEAAHAVIALVGAVQAIVDGKVPPPVNCDTPWQALAPAMVSKDSPPRRAVVLSVTPEGTLASAAVEAI